MPRRLAKDLTDRGLVIVSGLALFDQIAERGGDCQRRPSGHVSGCAEFPDSEPNHRWNKLRRGGWGAAQYSGFLITAQWAMQFGREVYGVRGNATQPSSFGPNQLIKQVLSW